MGKPRETIELMQLCEWMKIQHPKLLFTCDFIGMQLPIYVAIRMVKMRSAKWPDLFIAYPCGQYHGIFIEFKASGTKIYNKKGEYATQHMKEQGDVLKQLRELGYIAEMIVGFDNAVKFINKTMGC